VMPPPRHDKQKKWAVIRYQHYLGEKWMVEVYEDTENLRMHVNMHPNAELLIGGLTKLDADMWAKMME